MSRIKLLFSKSPFLPWVICLFFVSLFASSNGGVNEMSRFATMKAMSNLASFEISKYNDFTIDWSIKDGKIFSNKAPGPMILGFPAFFIVEKISALVSPQKDERKNGVTKTPRKLVSFINQVLPLAILCLIISSWLLRNGFDFIPVHFFMIAVLFGNTSSTMMNIYFGHGMAAIFTLAVAFFLIKKEYFYCGLFYGFLLLSEYTSALILIPLIVSIVYQEKFNFGWLKKLILGGLFPGILWSWYHLSTTGSIFKVTAMFQNPMWVDLSPKSEKLFGMFSLPESSVFVELLIGSQRGILFTQPWIFALILALPLIFLKTRKESLKTLIIFSSTGLLLMMMMNASFNGWHGGSSAGPRYLSLIFPVFGLIAAYVLNEFRQKYIIYILFVLLATSLVLFSLVTGATFLVPEGNNLWGWLYQFLNYEKPFKYTIKTLIVIICFLLSWFYTNKRGRNEFTS